MRLANLPMASLTMLRRNPQYLTLSQMEALKTSIKQDGFLVPILVQPIKNGRFEILSGNHRYMAANELGLEKLLAVIVKLSPSARQRVVVNLNTVHGEPPVETLAPFLAEMSDATLRSIHLDASTKRQLVLFDDTLEDRLAELQPPPELDRPSHPNIPDCICKTCGRRHVSARADLKSNSDASMNMIEQKESGTSADIQPLSGAT